MPTTAAQASAATGTVIKTMLQIATPSTRMMQLISWGYSIDTAQAAAGTVELLQTDVAATVIAHVASGLPSLDPNAPPSLMTLGVAATGYTASAEGTPAATRVFDAVKHNAGGTGASPVMEYAYQFAPDERPFVAVSKFLRVRATMGTTTGMLTWVVWDE